MILRNLFEGQVERHRCRGWSVLVDTVGEKRGWDKSRE